MHMRLKCTLNSVYELMTSRLMRLQHRETSRTTIEIDISHLAVHDYLFQSLENSVFLSLPSTEIFFTSEFFRILTASALDVLTPLLAWDRVPSSTPAVQGLFFSFTSYRTASRCPYKTCATRFCLTASPLAASSNPPTSLFIYRVPSSACMSPYSYFSHWRLILG